MKNMFDDLGWTTLSNTRWCKKGFV
jgi:hypothetical protein